MRHSDTLARFSRVTAIAVLVTALGCNVDGVAQNGPVASAPKLSTEPSVAAPLASEPQKPMTAADQQPIKPGPAKPFTHIFLGESIYLEVEQEPEQAIAMSVASAFTQAFGIAGHGGVATAGNRQFFVWQPTFEGGAKRRVVIDAEVCYREGYLEHLLSYGFKSHESVLMSKFDSRVLHLALEAAGAKRGKPVQFVDERGRERYRAPTGDPIRIFVRYDQDDKTLIRPAQQWVIHRKSKKPFVHGWVFAGSYIYKNPDGDEIYAANSTGRVICVSNFVQALLDVPVQSTDKENDGYEFGCNTPLIPPVETPVTLFLELGPKK